MAKPVASGDCIIEIDIRCGSVCIFALHRFVAGAFASRPSGGARCLVQVVVFAPEDFHLDSDVVAALVIVLPLPLASVVVVNIMEGDSLAVARLTGPGQEPGHAVRKIILNTNIRKA